MSIVKNSKCNCCGRLTEDKTKMSGWISFQGCVTVEKITHAGTINETIPRSITETSADFCNTDCMNKFIETLGKERPFYKTNIIGEE